MPALFHKDEKAENVRPRTKPSAALAERDAEAPEIFQAKEAALWDGRPSLGGIWVASPDTGAPERVIMRNGANGKSVIGALFKRERANSGPRLQVSSDAAEALGMLAGAPAEISVIALRRKEAEEPATGPAAAMTASDTKAIAGEHIETKALAPASGETVRPAENQPATGVNPETVAAVAAPESVKPDGRPIQIGTYAIESYAVQAVDKLSKEGIAAGAHKEKVKNKEYWTVTARGDTSLLQRIKAAGFADAYMLK